MNSTILDFSGSPVKNSKTDRLVRAVLESSGLPHEFIKLSRLKVKPCIACLGCTEDNICKVKDNFSDHAEKVKKASAIFIGGYPPYSYEVKFYLIFMPPLLFL